MKIYTKTGDKGETSLIGGVRVPKYHLRIECYGTVDELNSYIGYVKCCTSDPASLQLLAGIQDDLFTIGSHLAADPEKSRMHLPDLKEEDVLAMENEIDRMNESLPELRNFILPGGSRDNALCHVARCVCRRAERLVVHLSSESEVNPLIPKYLNRLSDYLFVLARKIAADTSVPETAWRPSRSNTEREP